MKKWVQTVVDTYLNAAGALVLMGATWLYLWAGPWRAAYVSDPRWGHNYAEALAFLTVGLALLNGRLISDWLALISSLLIVPVSLELWPVPVTAILAGVLAVLVIGDMIVERGRKNDIGQSDNRRLTFWLKRHLLRFALFMLGHMALIYFFVRLPFGTYEDELVTKVYDAMLLVFVVLAMMEGAVKKLWGIATPLLSFFWGIAMMLVALVLLIHQSDTWPVLGLTLVVTAVAIVALVKNAQLSTSEAP
jgi:hypothetical protein